MKHQNQLPSGSTAQLGTMLQTVQNIVNYLVVFFAPMKESLPSSLDKFQMNFNFSVRVKRNPFPEEYRCIWNDRPAPKATQLRKRHRNLQFLCDHIHRRTLVAGNASLGAPVCSTLTINEL